MIKGFQLGFISKEQMQQAHARNPLADPQLVSKIRRQASKWFHSDKVTGKDDDMYKMFNSRVDKLSKAGFGDQAQLWSAYVANLADEAAAAGIFLNSLATGCDQGG